MSNKSPLTILFLGLSNSGKTTMQYVLKFGEICTTIPTDGFNFHNLEYKKRKIGCYDYGGSKIVQEKLWPEALGKANGFFWVVDASASNTLNESVETLKSVVSNLPSKVPICIIANKYDLDSAMDKTDITSAFSAFSHSRVFHASAMNSESLKEALAWLMAEITGTKKEKKEKKDKKEKEKKEKKDNSKSQILSLVSTRTD